MAKSRVKKRPDGRYAMQIYLGTVDGKRKYKTVYGGTPKEVQKKADEVRILMGKGIDISAQRDTFKEWGNHWLKIKKAIVSSAHYKTCEQKLRIINCYIGDMPISQIKTANVQNIIFDLSSLNRWTGKPTAKRTLVEYRSVCRQVFQLAIENRIIDYNPASSVKIVSNQLKKERRALSVEEQGWIINTPHRAQKAAMIMMFAGLRRGEVIPLTWNDIDFEAGTIRVNKSVFKEGTRFNIKSGAKTESGNRVVNIPQILIDFLKLQPKDTILVCPDTKDVMMTETSWRRMWDSYIKDLNIKYGDLNGKRSKYDPKGVPITIPRITPHWLRHTFCTLLYLSGTDVLTAKEQMGHSDIKTTLGIYTHLDKEHKRNAVSKLNEYIETHASHMQVSIILKAA